MKEAWMDSPMEVSGQSHSSAALPSGRKRLFSILWGLNEPQILPVPEVE
jgi:hypothetical protein